MLCKKLFLASILFFVLVTLPLIGSVGASLELWSRTYGRAGGEVAYSLVVTSDGGYAIAGYTESFGAGDADFWLIKTDAYGNVEWNQTYGGSQYEYARSLVETSDGGFAVAGGMGDFWLVKTDNQGNMEWSRTYGGKDIDRAHSLIQTSDEGYALAGQTYSFDVGQGDFWLVKTDAEGNMEWNRTYGGKNIEIAHSLVEVSDGGYALAGKTTSFGAGSSDFWLVKTDAQGIPEFPSWATLIVTLTAVLVVAVIYRHHLNKSNQGRRKSEKVCISACSVDINSFA